MQGDDKNDSRSVALCLDCGFCLLLLGHEGVVCALMRGFEVGTCCVTPSALPHPLTLQGWMRLNVIMAGSFLYLLSPL